MKSWILVFLGIVIGISVISIMYFLQKTAFFEKPQDQNITPVITVTQIPLYTTTPNSQANILVDQPLPYQIVALPFTISGQARVFENQLQYRIVECEGIVLDQNILTAQSPDVGQFGPFKTEIYTLPATSGTNGCIEVFSNSPKDGSEINTVTTPIRFDFSKAKKISVYFGKKGQSDDCKTVLPVTRLTPDRVTPARAALNSLLNGPTSSEKEQGYFTSINNGVKIQKLTIENNTAKVDFDKQMEEQIGGSCRVTAIRSQIIETLKQFPNVKNVIISVDGRTEDILQP